MASELGAYLTARRAAVTPAEVGLPGGGRRRVPGLRREEVALLANVSADYYTRLEQGRETNPSAQVLDALSDALRLGDDGREHLHHLGGASAAPATPAGSDRVDAALLALMEDWPNQPALVHNRAYDVLAANALGEALFDGFGHTRNLMELVFLSPEARRFYPEWDTVARTSVAAFRLNHGADPGDSRIAAVLRRLLDGSAEFAALWAEHDARAKTVESKIFDHHEVGRVTLEVQSFGVRSAPGQELVVYRCEPGSPSANALALLGSIAATRRTEARALES